MHEKIKERAKISIRRGHGEGPGEIGHVNILFIAHAPRQKLENTLKRSTRIRIQRCKGKRICT